MMRIAALVLLVLPRAWSGQDEERGQFVVYSLGQKVGTETYRIEKFPDGNTGVFSKIVTTVEVRGKKVDVSNDTALTLDKQGRPSLYAGIAQVAGQTVETRMSIKDSAAAIVVKSGAGAVNRSVKLKAGTSVLDNDAFVQLVLVARSYDAKKGGVQPLRVLSVRMLTEIEGTVEDGGTAVLRSGDKSVAARCRLIKIGRLGVSVYLREEGGVCAVDSPLQGVTAFAPEYAGWQVVPSGPEIRRPDGVEETDVAFRSGTLTLAGSFTRPKGTKRVAAVVLIGGSGPQDRDGNPVPEKAKGTVSEGFLWKGIHWNIFRRIAYALSANGIGVLRCDKRGVGKSGGDFATAKLSDLTADVQAAVAYLRARDDVDPDRVGLVGHSEGAVIAPIVAVRDERIRALFLMAGTGKPFGDVILEQVAAALREQGLPDDVVQRQLNGQKELLAAVRNAGGDTMAIEERPTFIGWLKEELNHDPAAEIRKVKAPVVVMQGLKDQQVFPDNADLLEAAMKEAGKTNFEVKRFEGLDHLFMKARAGMADYADPSRSLDEGFLSYLVDRVRNWLQ